MGRLFHRDSGRVLGLAFDHALQLGPLPGMEDVGAVIAEATEAGVDALILTPGLLERYASQLQGRDRPAIILRLDHTTMWRVDAPTGYDQGRTELICSVEDAAALGADAVITFFFTGHGDPELERRTMAMSGEVSRAARRWGMVHIAETIWARNGVAGDPTDPATIALNARMAVEIGADIVKTPWGGTAESFEQVVQGAEAPVLVLGGTRDGSDADTLRQTDSILRSGAAGVLFGRTLFQADDRPALLRAMAELVHGRAPLNQALSTLEQAHGARV